MASSLPGQAVSSGVHPDDCFNDSISTRFHAGFAADSQVGRSRLPARAGQPALLTATAYEYRSDTWRLCNKVA
eukprot:scaffold378823_cov41-Prasinocladus_malaysianus.AAC.1